MLVLAKGGTGRWPRQNLYLVPERIVARALHAPAGRTLHLVDLENLMGGPTEGLFALANASRAYGEAAGVHPGDHVIVAVNPALAVSAGHAWAGSRLLSGPGHDGADRALLAVVSERRWVAARYDRVIFGSGDGIFANAASELRDLGIAVGVIAPKDGLSRRLGRSATFVRAIPEMASLIGVA